MRNYCEEQSRLAMYNNFQWAREECFKNHYKNLFQIQLNECFEMQQTISETKRHMNIKLGECQAIQKREKDTQKYLKLLEDQLEVLNKYIKTQ